VCAQPYPQLAEDQNGLLSELPSSPPGEALRLLGRGRYAGPEAQAMCEKLPHALPALMHLE